MADPDQRERDACAAFAAFDGESDAAEFFKRNEYCRATWLGVIDALRKEDRKRIEGLMKALRGIDWKTPEMRGYFDGHTAALQAVLTMLTEAKRGK